MGFFSNDSEEADVSDERVEKLVQNAQSDTVNSDLLTQTDTTGMLSDGINLSDQPLINHLNDEEQPNFIWYVSDLGELLDENLLLCVTDCRIIVIKYGSNVEDSSVTIPFESVYKFNMYDNGGIEFYITDDEIVDTVYSWYNGELKKDYKKNLITVRTPNNFNENTERALEQYLNENIEFDELNVENTSIKEELYVNTYHVEDQKTDNLPNASELLVTFGQTGIKFGENYDEIAYSDIAEIRDYKDVQLQEYSSSDSGYMSLKRKGIDIITTEGIHAILHKFNMENIDRNTVKKAELSNTNQSTFEFLQGALSNLEDIDDLPEFPEFITKFLDKRSEQFANKQLPSEYILIRPHDKSSLPKLKVEGWTEGSSEVNANVDADSESRGKSKGIELGMFTRSKTSSKSSIEGDISGEITDNTYTSDVKAFKIYDDSLVIDSEIKLDLHYSEIDSIHEQDEGVVIEVASTSFRISNVSHPDKISEATSFVKDKLLEFDKMSSSQDEKTDNSTESADKIKELNQLHEEGILTDEEFESKKKDILDDF